MGQDAFSPRKSARQERARATIDAIVEGATRLLGKGGLGRLNTNAIAEVAGVSIGSVYQYFPAKDAVLQAVMERAFAQSNADFIATIDGIDASRVPLEEAIGLIFDRVAARQRQHGPIYRQLLLATLSFRHLRFVIQNDAQTLAALRRKLLDYGPRVDTSQLELVTLLLLYALKGIQLGFLFHETDLADPRVRALVIRYSVACLTPVPGAPVGDDS